MKITEWICDNCNNKINGKKEGYMEWLKDRETKKEDYFRIVHHHKACLYDKVQKREEGYDTLDDHLKYFVGEDGLQMLLNILNNDCVNRKEVIKIIQRLHIPGFETARFHFKEARREGYINGPSNGIYDITVEQINKINNLYHQ